MRLALIALACAALAACGGKADKAPPEQRAAPGEVLGGEVTDDMLPTDTVRSTSPVNSSVGSTSPDGDTATPTAPSRDAPSLAPPRPLLTAAPMPDMTMPADPEPRRTDDD